MPAISSIPAVPGHVLEVNYVFRDKYHRITSFCMHYRIQAGGTLPTYAQLHGWTNGVHVAFGEEVDDIMDHEAHFACVEARYQNNEGAEVYALSNENLVPGTMGDIVEDPGAEIEASPPEVALCIRKVTHLAGRQNRGRIFLPCISEAAIHDGMVDELNHPAVKEIITQLMEPAEIPGVGVPLPVLWNRKDNKLVDILYMACNQFSVTRKDRKWKERPLLIVP